MAPFKELESSSVAPPAWQKFWTAPKVTSNFWPTSVSPTEEANIAEKKLTEPKVDTVHDDHDMFEGNEVATEIDPPHHSHEWVKDHHKTSHSPG